MAAIQDHSQDGQQHVQVEDWPKSNGAWFFLQVSILNTRAIVAISVVITAIQNVSQHVDWLKIATPLKLEFWIFLSFPMFGSIWVHVGWISFWIKLYFVDHMKSNSQKFNAKLALN